MDSKSWQQRREFDSCHQPSAARFPERPPIPIATRQDLRWYSPAKAERTVLTSAGTRDAQARIEAEATGFCLCGMVEEPPRSGGRGLREFADFRFAYTEKDRGKFFAMVPESKPKVVAVFSNSFALRVPGDARKAEALVLRPAAWQFACRDRQEQRECPQRHRTGVPGNSRVDLRDVYDAAGTRRASPAVDVAEGRGQSMLKPGTSDE